MTIESYKDRFVDQPTRNKNSKYVTVFLMRKAESECIFRTDNEISNELTYAGLNRRDMDGYGGMFARAFMSKRKAIAPERRTGRAILRKLGLLKTDDKGNTCSINKTMCGKCIDCWLYGSAVGNSVSRKSHVVSDESFSLSLYGDVTDEHTFNALYETGTMRDLEDKQSQAINTDEVVRPGTIFLDMETISDVTMDEFIYILGNIIRTKRYGALSTRIGKMNNIIVGIAFSNCELFSNLEWTQATYDDVCSVLDVPEGKRPQFPVDPTIVFESATNAMKALMYTIHGDVLLLDPRETIEIMKQVSEMFKDEKKLGDALSKWTIG